jgi:hypothetical protein
MRKIIFSLAFFSQAVFASSFSAYDFISIAYSGIKFMHTKSVPEEIVITETGIGKTQNEAIEQALHIAIQRGIGILVVSDQTVKNDTLVRNVIANYSSGVVNSYKIDTCKKTEYVSCTVTAKISPWKFMRKLEGDSNSIRINGNNLYAQAISSKVTMEQRRRIAEYYFSSIRKNGLDAKIREVKIIPSTGDKVKLSISYDVRWNSEYKKSMIAFLEKLEEDTKGEESQQVYIQWGPTGLFENRVRINTSDFQFREMVTKHLYEPIQIKIDGLDKCEIIQPAGDIFKIDWYGLRRQTIIEVQAEKLKNIDQLTISTSCQA